MPLDPGTRLGPYEIVSLIGSGGMGEVYKARDARLSRTVAIKTLTQHISADSDLKKRFEREAQAVGALNHPHICVLHDIGVQDGVEYLVMELVEGETLASRLETGPLPLAQALKYAAQIADALDKAHRQGVLHRDLKPGNIMIAKTGAKLLDFGLAKLRESSAPAGPGQSLFPTRAGELTAQGTILGTLHYMAPEQLEGRDTDERADIFSFGAVLYEMVTGKKAFDGRSQASIIAAILDQQPVPVSSLQPTSPASVDYLIRVCLDKDPAQRWQSAHDIFKYIEWIGAQDAASASTSIARRSPSSIGWIAAAAVLALTTIAAALAYVFREVSQPRPGVFTVSLPSNLKLLTSVDAHGGIISPDGRSLVFSGVNTDTGQVMLYRRLLDSVDPSPIPGTEGGTYPFWSPDSQNVAFYAQGKLKRVGVSGGPPQVICDATTGGWGGTWNSNDVIVAGVEDPGPLSKVSAKGGRPVPVTSLAEGGADHDWPQFLPDGNHFLYFVLGGGAQYSGLFLGALDSTDRTPLVTGLNASAYAYVDPGYLLFVRGTTLMAQAFDARSLKLSGDLIPLVENARAPISASSTGVVSYRAIAASSPDRMLWVSRDGSEQGTALPPGYYADPSVSPDGSMIAFAKKQSLDASFDIWIRDVANGTERRLTFDAADDRTPVWSPDGRSIVFSSSPRAPRSGLYRKNANGAGDEELIRADPTMSRTAAYQWSPDGRFVTFYDGRPSYDISMLLFDGLKHLPLVKTAVNELRGAVSPDGRWFAYDSRDTARFEVYLTTFPPSSSKWMVTTEGGAEPKWSKDGKTLFYVNSLTGGLMSVDVKTGLPPQIGAHKRVHAGPLDWGWDSARSFDVDSIHDRFLVETLTVPGDIAVLVDWRALLKK